MFLALTLTSTTTLITCWKITSIWTKLQACSHETTELTKAISDCQEAKKNMHDTAIKARQHFDHVGLQGTVRKQLDDSEKDIDIN